MTFIETYIAKKVLDAALKTASTYLSSIKSSIQSTPEDMMVSLENHLKEVKNWASEVSFGDLITPKRTQRIFVELDCYVIPRYRRIAKSEPVERIPFDKLFSSQIKHFVFLGTPGAGKTTSMKHLCDKILFSENFASERINYPILIRLRSLNNTKGAKNSLLLVEIARILGIKIEYNKEVQGRSKELTKIRISALKDAICSVLDHTKAFLILDGFDELSYSLQETILEQVRSLILTLDKSTLTLTCRTGEFPANLDNAQVFELCELGSQQIHDFASKWLGPGDTASTFLKQVNQSPFSDSAIKPLTLAHLCALYERIGSIPEKPKTVYRKIFHLFLADWDEQRSVKRQSKYAGFDADRKYEMLSHISYLLTLSSKSLTFSSRKITSIYKKIHQDFGLPLDEGLAVAKELESHTGLFIHSGFGEFEFAHKSLQEFLAAEFLVRLPKIPKDKNSLLLLPNELAIAVAISSNPSSYFTELVLNRFRKTGMSPAFLSSFTTRLMQEKVDFNADKTVILSLLILYSMVVEGASTDDPQPKLFMFDEMTQEFEHLMSAVIKSNQHFHLNDFYRYSSEARVTGNSMVYAYYRVKSIKDYSLPREIFVRHTFMPMLKQDEHLPKFNLTQEKI